MCLWKTDRRLSPKIILLLILPFLCTGCLVFEKQTIHAIYDEKADVVHAVLVYEGLHVSGTDKQNLKNAKFDLQDLVKDNDSFYIANPIVRIRLSELKNPPKLGEFDKEYADMILTHVSLTPGKMFVKDKDKLCYSQGLTIRQAKSFVAKANHLISRDIIKNAKRANQGNPKQPEWQKELQKKILIAAQNKHAWIRLQPGRLSVTTPMNDQALANAKLSLLALDRLDEFKKRLKDTAKRKDWKTYQSMVDGQFKNQEFLGLLLKSNVISLDHRKDSATFSVGYGGTEPIPGVFPFFEDPEKLTKYDKEFQEYAKTLQEEWDNNTTVERVLTDFRKKHLPK